MLPTLLSIGWSQQRISQLGLIEINLKNNIVGFMTDWQYKHTHTHARAHARMHARAHARTYTHTHTPKVTHIFSALCNDSLLCHEHIDIYFVMIIDDNQCKLRMYKVLFENEL